VAAAAVVLLIHMERKAERANNRPTVAIIAITTARSCTVSKPTAMRPCRRSNSRLSDSRLTMVKAS